MRHYLIGYDDNMFPPESPEEVQAHQKRKEWVQSLGHAIINPGTSLGVSEIVRSAGIQEDDWSETMFG